MTIEFTWTFEIESHNLVPPTCVCWISYKAPLAGPCAHLIQAPALSCQSPFPLPCPDHDPWWYEPWPSLLNSSCPLARQSLCRCLADRRVGYVYVHYKRPPSSLIICTLQRRGEGVQTLCRGTNPAWQSNNENLTRPGIEKVNLSCIVQALGLQAPAASFSPRSPLLPPILQLPFLAVIVGSDPL